MKFRIHFGPDLTTVHIPECVRANDPQGTAGWSYDIEARYCNEAYINLVDEYLERPGPGARKVDICTGCTAPVGLAAVPC